ncbi:ComEC family competence protein [Candidatus Parcubacteria bacterium]|nr:ComEC family competence protein [Candidatus Parcubacteria bacterium]
MSASKIFFYFCLSFISGIFISSFFPPSLYIIWAGLIFCLILISVFWKYKNLVIFSFYILFLILGVWQHQQYELKITNSELRNYNDLEQKITLTGIVSAESDVRDTNVKLTIKPNKIQNGKILITVNKYPEYNYGDKLKITGFLKTPGIFEDFNYKDYLAKDGIYSVMYQPKIQLLEIQNGREHFSPIYKEILKFKNKLKQTIEQNLSPPQSSILGSMILGDKRKISEDIKNKLNITGLRHITCVSGMHIIILSGILMWLGIFLGLWRGQAFYFAAFLLFLFIIMVGAPASAVRAGIMGGLLLLGQKIGRLRASSRAITFAGALMLFQNPLLLKSDVGFQLSFLASFGIIYLMPIFQYYYQKIPNFNFVSIQRLFSPIKDILSMTLAAQIFTLPILIYNFGYFSQISLLTNVLIVPLLPFIMVFGFAFGLAGIISSPLAWILSLPCWFLLTYIVGVINFFSKIPWAVQFLEISWIWLLISYFILGLVTWYLNEKQKLKFLDY